MDFNLIPTQLDGAHVVLLLGLLACLMLAARRASPEAAQPLSPAPTSAPEPAAPPVPEPVKPALTAHDPASALQLLGLFQQDARLIDFLHENLTGFSDADVGAAARVVHEGGRKVLQQYLSLAPVRPEEEESRITVPAGFNPAEIRLTGQVSGQPPFTGTLIHRGWKVTRIQLPTLAEGHDPHLITPAEVEL